MKCYLAMINLLSQTILLFYILNGLWTFDSFEALVSCADARHTIVGNS